MQTTLYKASDKELPFNISTQYYKWVEDGENKSKYELRWAVKTSEVNNFIESAATSYEGKALLTPSKEERGPLTIVTLTYGDQGLIDSYNEDGEISWWSCSNGVLSYHIRRWVTNTPNDIKNFCQSCMSNYGYLKDEVTVTCNPTPGEVRVMCEAVFTPESYKYEEDPTENEDWTGDEEDTKQETESVQCSSSIDTLSLSAHTYLEKKLNVVNTRKIITIINGVDSGEFAYKRVGDYRGRIKTAGWYRTDTTNPNALDNPAYMEDPECTKSRVDIARILLKSVPDVAVPSLRVTVTTKITAGSKTAITQLTSKMSDAGKMTPTITNSGLNIPAPQFPYAWDSEGTQYAIEKTEWLNEGSSFDGTTIKKRTSWSTGLNFYEGTISTSYRTVSTLQATLKDGTDF